MADNTEKKCEYCGAAYTVSDGYCKQCWKRIPPTASPKEELLNGVKKADWHFFIDKNASRYVGIYAENENKKLFLSWNWAAFFFGVNWMCYRKMYKNAALFAVIYSVLALCVTLLISCSYRGQLTPPYKEVAEYEQNYNADDYTANNPDLIIEVNGQPIRAYEAEKEIYYISIKITLWSVLVIIVLQIPIGLSADCIYRSHILKKIKYSDGGASYIAFFAGGICNNIFNRFIVSPIALALIKMIMK